MSTLRTHWESLGRAGLLGVGLPSRFGGQGGGPPEVRRAARRVGHTSFDLGVGLSWLVHHIVSRFQLGRFGTEEQKAAWLPHLASGEAMAATSSVATREGEAELSASAADADHYHIVGTLPAVINAPAADLLVLFAQLPPSDEDGGLAAFLIHRDTPGVSYAPGDDRGYCPTSPLARVTVDSLIPRVSQLGTVAQAREMLDQLDEQFDVLRLQVISGYLGQLLLEVRPLMRRSDRSRLAMLVLDGRLQALRSLNAHLAERWDSPAGDPVDFVAAEAAARELVRLTRQDLADLPDHPAVVAAQRDLQLVRLGWAQTRDRILAVARAAETDLDPLP